MANIIDPVLDDQEDQEVGEGDGDVARTMGEKQQGTAGYGRGCKTFTLHYTIYIGALSRRRLFFF